MTRDMKKKYPILKAIDALRDMSEHSVRGLAEKAGIGVSTAKTFLDYLFSQGIVKKKVIGRSHLYKIDTSNFLARHLKILFSLSELNDSGLVSELKKYPINSIVLYGSVARGEDDMKSDVDILIVTRKKSKITPLKAEQKLRRELTILAFTLPEWRMKAREDKVFYDRIITDGIPLVGNIPIVS